MSLIHLWHHAERSKVQVAGSVLVTLHRASPAPFLLKHVPLAGKQVV